MAVGKLAIVGILAVGTSAVVQSLAGRNFTTDRSRVVRNFVEAKRIITKITPMVVSKLVVKRRLIK